MAKFSEAILEDHEMLRQKMADNARAADSHLETTLNSVSDWTSKLMQAFNFASKDIKVSSLPYMKVHLLTEIPRMSTRQWTQ